MAIDITALKKRILQTVMSVPGVAGLQYGYGDGELEKTISTSDNSLRSITVYEAPEIVNICINIVLMEGINLKDVCQEVQILTRYDIDKNFSMDKKYFVHIFVQDILINKQ